MRNTELTLSRKAARDQRLKVVLSSFDAGEVLCAKIYGIL